MKRHIYVEFLKETSHSVNNAKTLDNSLMIWGNHDFLKITICKDGTQNQIEWLKSAYSENRPDFYDGVERQPLFITDFMRHDQTDVIANLSRYQDTAFDDAERPVFMLTLFQLDYFEETSYLTKKSEKELLLEIDKTIKSYNNSELNEPNLFSQSFLNLGESDLCVLFQSERFEPVAQTITMLKRVYPIAKSYTLIVFPYRYNDIISHNSQVKNTISNNLIKWIRCGDGSHYELVSQFVIDNRYREILQSQEPKVKENLKVIFGDYDIQLNAAPNELIDNNLTIANYEHKYRYSKTSLQIPLKDENYPTSISNAGFEEQKYSDDVNRLKEAFENAIKTISNSNIPRKNTVAESLNSARKTFINLHNYFISLHETRYAPDVYMHILPIFAELGNALEYLSKYCQFSNNDSYEYVVLSVDHQIRRLMECIQQFLGIVSLSPRTFSEAHGSYMRSANAALKLICAYHSAVYLMHKATKCELGEPNSQYGYERGECAVLILPGRDSRTTNNTMFTALSPQCHISVIEANFNSLFMIKKMLFQLAHEVGHFSGDRKRTLRKPLFVSATMRYVLYIGLFEKLLKWPHTISANQIRNNKNDDENKVLENLDIKLTADVKASIFNCEKHISNIADIISNIILNCVNEMQEYACDDHKSQDLKFKLNYLEELIKVISKKYDDIRMQFENNEEIICSFKSLAEEITELFRKTQKNICSNRNVSFRTKRVMSARLLEENTIQRTFERYLKRLHLVEGGYVNDLAINVIEPVFEDIYSDIYAIKILALKETDYVEYILNNENDSDYYNTQIFLMRFYTVLRVFYKCSDKKIREYLRKQLPNDWANECFDQLDFIVQFKSIFLEKEFEYAQLFTNKLKKSNETELIRNFYNNPEIYLYDMWKEGLKRE